MVTARESETSYVNEIRRGSKMKVHSSFLKPWVEEEVVGNPMPLFYHQSLKLIWVCNVIVDLQENSGSSGQWRFLGVSDRVGSG